MIYFRQHLTGACNIVEQKPTQPTPSKSRDLKTTLLISIVALLVIVIGFLVYILINQDDPKTASITDKETTGTVNSAEKTKQTPSTTPDQYQGWKSYPDNGLDLGNGRSDINPLTHEDTLSFRFPATWKSVMVIDCPFAIGDEALKGVVCFKSKNYSNGQAVDSFVDSLVANSSDYSKEKTITIGKSQAIVVSSQAGVNKYYHVYVNNLNSMNLGTYITYGSDSTNTSEVNSFIADVEKLLESLDIKAEA